MTCALDGVHRTPTAIVMCDGEVHMTIHQPVIGHQAEYSYCMCPNFEEPPTLPLKWWESLAVWSLVGVAVSLWLYVLILIAGVVL